MKRHYPNWVITKTLEGTVEEIVNAWQDRIKR
jgi:hypothetical protein